MSRETEKLVARIPFDAADKIQKSGRQRQSQMKQRKRLIIKYVCARARTILKFIAHGLRVRDITENNNDDDDAFHSR